MLDSSFFGWDWYHDLLYIIKERVVLSLCSWDTMFSTSLHMTFLCEISSLALFTWWWLVSWHEHDLILFKEFAAFRRYYQFFVIMVFMFVAVVVFSWFQRIKTIYRWWIWFPWRMLMFMGWHRTYVLIRFKLLPHLCVPVQIEVFIVVPFLIETIQHASHEIKSQKLALLFLNLTFFYPLLPLLLLNLSIFHLIFLFLHFFYPVLKMLKTYFCFKFGEWLEHLS